MAEGTRLLAAGPSDDLRTAALTTARDDAGSASGRRSHGRVASLAVGAVLAVAGALAVTTQWSTVVEQHAAEATGAAKALAPSPETELGSLKSAYCNLTIPKMTWAVSEPDLVAAFMLKHMPVTCETDGGFTDYSLCKHHTETCGGYVRLALNGSNEGVNSACFGIHLVHASARPTGPTPLSTIETHFANRLGSLDTYDAFMDYALVLYVHLLDPYIEDFEKNGVDYLLLKWKDNSDIRTATGSAVGRHFFSLIVHVPNSSINFELVSAIAPRGTQHRPMHKDSLVRLPHSSMQSAGAAAIDHAYAVPLAISKGTSNLDEVRERC